MYLINNCLILLSHFVVVLIEFVTRVTYTYVRLIIRQNRFSPQELFPIIFEEERKTNERLARTKNGPKRSKETDALRETYPSHLR